MPDERKGSTTKCLPINSKTIIISSPVPPNPLKFGEIKALNIPISEHSSQNFLLKPVSELDTSWWFLYCV